MIFESWYEAPQASLPEGDLSRFCGVWATVPARRDEMEWINDDSEYEVSLTLMGDNFDALGYTGRLKVQRYTIDAGDMASGQPFTAVGVKWLRPLSFDDG